MKLFNFSAANCKNCYKCVRSCPVKAIKFTNDVAEIDEEKCIACGRCFVVCPKHARNVENDVEEVKHVLAEGKRPVYACVDSSYIGLFDDPSRFVSALKKLGFASVQETAVGAERIMEKYIDYVGKRAEQKYIISSSCPTIYLYIQKYYPSLSPYLIPIVTPMTALGRLIQKEDPLGYTVYIGPCLSKKYETFPKGQHGAIDASITFVEILRMLHWSNINIEKMEPCAPDRVAQSFGFHYSIAGDMWASLKYEAVKNKFDVFHVTGVENARNIFQSMIEGNLEKAYISIAACVGSCLNGPFMPKNTGSVFVKEQKVKQFVFHGWKKPDILPDWDGIDLSCEHKSQQVNRKKASKEEIEEILRKMDKHSRDDELDCGACGYNSCREKAQAVFENMASVEMCMPYMRSRAENMNDIIFYNVPNIIITLDKNLIVTHFNPIAEKSFDISWEQILGKPISTLMDDGEFRRVLERKKDVINKKIRIPQYDLVVMENLIYLSKEEEIIVTMQDITEDEKRRQELDKLRKQTVEIAQNVIEKQMRVAQNIASLLGETTAETKVALNKLKDVVIKEGDD